MSAAQPLAGKITLVTGAGRGIGRAIALGYARAGAAVVCAARTQSQIEAVAAQILAAGGQALALPVDVTQRQEVEALFNRAAAAFGGLDIAVLNAGVYLDWNPVAQSDPEAWEQTIAVNLLGTYYCARAAIPHLRQRGSGKIITIGSGLGHRGSQGSSAYSCSKAGLWMLTRVLAQELRPFGISVNELIPGPVRTTQDQHRPDTPSPIPQLDQEWVKEPEEVMPLALFLATQPEPGPTAQSFSLMRRDG